VASPVVVGGRLWGAIVASSRSGPLAPGTEQRMAEFTDLLGIAIANADGRAQLRASRARIVAAADETRRRVERDLHDGVQQQLVALAVRLRRLAAAEASGAALEEVAAEAEEAVFALQELARGIFPSVLADQGLAAALRAQASRLPLDVRVELEPALARRRFEREVEAALYFVALEAMANLQKHAPASSATVSLRLGGDAGSVVLEVHDDGPGFDPAARGEGTGLQNMADRVAAVGGGLHVDSRPGGGTWIRAEAPLGEPAAAVLHIADSRR
jgi:signal transduction histidine kinase